MHYRYCILLLAFVLLPSALLGQKQYNIWYFGYGGGVDFSAPVPAPLTNGAMGLAEGCATICDKQTGALLFYTDGVTVWNRNHQTMPNGTGLDGSISTTQSVVIVPDPGNTSLYYIFTADAYEHVQTNPKGISYSIVDMRLNGGNGDVIEKNHPLLTPATEKLCAVRHCNKHDYWVIAHGYGDDKYYAWLISDAGVSLTPVISPIGSVLTGENSPGYLKASPSGRMLASVLYLSSTVELFNFDNTTGIVYNFLPLSGSSSLRVSYGASFSPDNSRLYTVQGIGGSPCLVQYSLLPFVQTSIIASRTVVRSINQGDRTGWGAMQIGPNKQIYIAKSDAIPPRFATITSPNSFGTACNYIDSIFAVPCYAGLPNQIETEVDAQNVDPSVVTNISLCRGDTISFSAGPVGSNYHWSPSTGLSCEDCRGVLIYPQESTVYTIEVRNPRFCTRYDTVKVTVNDKPTVDAGEPQTICPGESVTLAATDAASWKWSPPDGLSCTGCRSPVASPKTTTLYTVAVTNKSGCTATDTVRLVVRDGPSVDAGATAAICRGDSTVLKASGGVNHHWSPGDGLSCTDCASPTAYPAVTTLYTVTVTGDNGCTATDTVRVIVSEHPNADAGPTKEICRGGSTVLRGSGGGSYRWSPGDGLSCLTCAEPRAYPSATTLYTLTVVGDSGCVVTDTVSVVVLDSFVVDAGASQILCRGDSTVLAASDGSTWNWVPSVGLSCTDCRNPVASPDVTTIYTLTMENDAGCRGTDTVRITVLPSPKVQADGDATICAGEIVQLHAAQGENYHWEPSTGLSCTDCSDPTAQPLVTTLYYVSTVASNGCRATDSVLITVVGDGSVDAGPSRSICSGGSVELQASDGATWQWSPSAGLSCTDCRSPIASPSTTTLYTVTVSAAGGCSGSDTVSVTVLPLPVIGAGADVEICAGESVRLQASGGASYQWSPPDGLSCTDCASPVASPSATTTYTVIGTNADGCTGSDEVTVHVGTGRTVVAHIARTYRIPPGGSVSVPIELDAPIATAVDTLLISLTYNPGVLQLKDIEVSGMGLAGWQRETIADAYGNIALRMIATASGGTLPAGALLALRFAGYLGDSVGSELPFSIALPGQECVRVETSPGLVMLDSICGLSYRLIELSPAKYALGQNTPNPFNPITQISFSIAFDSPTRLEVYSMGGERVAVLVDDVLGAGSYEAEWDAGSVPSGLYYYRIVSGSWNQTRQMVVVK